MGGDYAPQSTLEGAVQALSSLKDNTHLALIGPEKVIGDFLAEKGINDPRIEIHHASEYIRMEEHPIKALQSKPDSSLSVGYKMLSSAGIDVLASAGHSGAVMVGALQSVRQIEGVLRPCVATGFPLEDGGKNVLLDVGINADCKPEMLVQFAVLGSIYAREVLGIENPRVGLLNTGSEEGKGSLLYQKAHEMLKEDKTINFIGNLEARHFFEGQADVSVCDGFTGNIVLKLAEAFYGLVKNRNIEDDYLGLFNYEQYGGTPVLGIQGNVVLGHGISSANAIENMILAAEMVGRADLANCIKKAF